MTGFVDKVMLFLFFLKESQEIHNFLVYQITIKNSHIFLHMTKMRFNRI